MTDPKQIEQELLMRELASRKLDYFTKYTKSDYQMIATQWGKPIHSRIIEKLEKVEQWFIKRLMIFCPPRIGKSELVSKRFPAWCLWKNPKRNIIVSSYGADLASDFGRKTKQIVESTEFHNIFPWFALSKDKKEWGNWETANGWGLYTIGVGGALTGKGGDLLIGDDLVKNREEAESEKVQTSTIDWWTSTFYTRKQSENSAIVLMMTRWNINDIAGYLIREQENGWDKWDILVIQGIDENGDEIIWEGKWSKGFMLNEKANLSPKDWAALYQQDPIASSSNIFKLSDMRYYLRSDFEKADGILKKEDMKFVLFVDPAWSSSAKSDDAVAMLIGKHRISGNYYLFDMYAGTSAPSLTYAAILAMYDNAIMDWFRVTSIDIEHVALSRDQRAFIDGFKEFLKEADRYITVNMVTPVGKKEERIKLYLEPKLSLHAIHLPRDMKDKALINKIEDQLRDFPNSKKDDAIDCLASGVNRLDHKWEATEKPKDRYFHNRKTWKMEVIR